jgi:2,3-bisphosphoglycerate-independent phosphoglycerate mutase
MDEKQSAMVEAIRAAYLEGQEDEALEPIIAFDGPGSPAGRMKNGEYAIFYDIRGEREIELTRTLTEKDFRHIPVKPETLLNFVTMIEYHSTLKARVAFPPEGRIRNTLAEVLSNRGFRFLKVAESEKAVHISYFMNGKNEAPFPGEDRIVVPSPEAGTYTEFPEMAAAEVRKALAENLGGGEYKFIAANLANVDVVGHIEDEKAACRAVECVDGELGRIIDLCREHRVTLCVTADHGTVEEWLYPDGAVNTGHTKNRVPFILADFSGQGAGDLRLRAEGELADVASTVLELLGVEAPVEMTGRSLLEGHVPVRDRRVLLLILDGWGIREERKGNLIYLSATPQFDMAWEIYPRALLQASGEAVGMPPLTVGNSESGHLHLGAGRRILLDRVKIDAAIRDGSFFENQAFLWAMNKAREEGKPLHFLGIVSFYSSHGTIDHLEALLDMAARQKLRDVYVHCLLGRRGEKPESGSIYVHEVEKMCRRFSVGRVVTVMGRYWALDREENWPLVEKAYRALVYGEGRQVSI